MQLLVDSRIKKALALGLGLATACTSGDGGDVPARWAQPLVTEETLSIGLLDGPEEYVFGEVASVAADDGGLVYVADPIANLVRVYDTSGGYMGQVGRDGEGPGEYARPIELAFSRDGLLYLESSLQVQVFAAHDPDGIRDDYLEVRIKDGRPFDDRRRGRVDRRGRYLQPARILQSDGDVFGWYMNHEGMQPDLKPVEVPQYPGIRRLGIARYVIYEDPSSPAYSARIVDGLAAAPFEPVPSWTMTVDATVVGGPGDQSVLYETDFDGDTLRTITWERPGRETPREAVADSAAALRDRLASIEVALSEVDHASPVALSGQLPDSLPAFIAVYSAEPSGNLWVEVWPEVPGTRLFDVLTPDGVYVESVEIPAHIVKQPAPYITDDAIYGVVRDPETDVDRVVRLDIRRPGRGG